MNILSLVKKNSLLILIILIIISILSSIYFLNLKTEHNTLIGYNNLKQKIQEARKIEEISNSRSFNSMLDKITKLENKNLTKDQQLTEVKYAWLDLWAAYAETNNHQLYILASEYIKFAEVNFKEFKVNVECLDPTCTKKSVATEILNIMDEIKRSTVSAEFQDPFLQSLTSFSYINNDDLKATDYLTLADSIKLDGEFSKAGLNLKIYNEIRDYVKIAYPELYKKYSNHVFIQ